MKKVVIKAEKICKDYGNKENLHHVLKNIDLDIYEGDFTVIMGSSGSGKSTLLYALSLMDQPTKGNIHILGTDISKMSENDVSEVRRKRISFIFQNINLLPDLTALENITYPAYLTMSKKDANDKAMELLRQFNLEEVKDKYPGNMSGGQQQRVAIARAIATDPDILFADEPTGALNSAAGKQVLDLFTELNKKGQSIVMVTHDIKACTRGNRILYLSDGQIVGEFYPGPNKLQSQQKREDEIFQFLKEHHW
ncbi:MAG: ABC transporter ATP-binding protein [Lachnospiraceae bacterium]|nr:ABC transporter ATP-binding protein [Lachnospiraceae bacterium]